MLYLALVQPRAEYAIFRSIGLNREVNLDGYFTKRVWYAFDWPFAPAERKPIEDLK